MSYVTENPSRVEYPPPPRSLRPYLGTALIVTIKPHSYVQTILFTHSINELSIRFAWKEFTEEF